jgi:hypothetical protein
MKKVTTLTATIVVLLTVGTALLAVTKFQPTTQAFAALVHPKIVPELARSYPNLVITHLSNKPTVSGPCKVVEDKDGYSVVYSTGFYMSGNGKISDQKGAFAMQVITPSLSEQTDKFQKMLKVRRDQVLHPWKAKQIVEEAKAEDEKLGTELIKKYTKS